MKSIGRWIVSAVLIALVACGGSVRKEQEQRLAHLRIMKAAVMLSGQTAACANHFRALLSASEYAKVTGKDFVSASSTVLGSESRRMRQELISGKADVEDLLARLDPVPEGFQNAVDKLEELHEVYLKIYNLSVNPPGSLESGVDKIAEWEKAFDAGAGEFETMLSEIENGGKE